MLDGHCGIDDWEIILIDKGRNKQETRKKELFWQYKLDIFVPHGLNERVVDLEWYNRLKQPFWINVELGNKIV